MTKRMSPTPYLAIRCADELQRRDRACSSNELSDAPDEANYIALRRFDQELAMVLAYIGTEKVEPCIDVRDPRFLCRETKTPLRKEG